MKTKLIIIIAFLFNFNFLFATDTKGNDFWLNFLPNFHSSNSERTDSLIINIITDEVTNCRIEYTDFSGNKFDSSFTILNTNQTYFYKLYWKNFELKGINYLLDVSSTNQCDKIVKQSFHISSDKNISVVAYSKAYLTNDAFLVYPTESLGNEYFVMSYNSDASIGFGNIISEVSTPSQFSMCATEDSTLIEITPKSPTNIKGILKQNILLNKGDSYLVQANMSYDNLNIDLTGTKISSNKPIAIFSGHQRATITINSGNDQTSRDFIAEQMIPTNLLGNNYIIFPFSKIKNITPFGNNIFRILAVKDNTKINFNNQYIITLNSGEFYEGKLDSIINVTSSNPIMIAEFTKSSSDANTNNYNYGDPMMLILTPNERFGNIKKVNCFQFSEINNITGNKENAIKEQYITIIAPKEGLNNIKIDSNYIKKELFEPIINCNFSKVTIKVTDGIHSIFADNAIATYVYGYGPAVSYAYNGGFSTLKLDISPPVINVLKNCSSNYYSISDSSKNDSGVGSILFPTDKNKNVYNNLGPHSNVSLLKFSSNLINKFEDGEIYMIVNDSIGNSRIYQDSISGFTLGLINKYSPNITEIKETLYSKTLTNAFNFNIYNYGNFYHFVNVKLSTPNSKVSFKSNFNIMPKSVDTFQIYYNDTLSFNLVDSLIFYDDCDTLLIAKININFVHTNIEAELSNQNNLTFYPNPILDYLFINLDREPMIDEELEIYNLLGVKVFTTKISKINNAINLKSLNSSLYFGKLKLENKIFNFQVAK